MAPSNSDAAFWTSVMLILAVAMVLAAHAFLLHDTSDRGGGKGLFSRKGRFTRPLRRKVDSVSKVITIDRERVASATASGEAEAQTVESRPRHFSHPPVHGLPTSREDDGEVWDLAARWVRRDPNEFTRSIVQRWIDDRDEDSAKM